MDEVERCVEIDAAAHVAVADRTQERSVVVLAVLQPEMGVERLTESLSFSPADRRRGRASTPPSVSATYAGFRFRERPNPGYNRETKAARSGNGHPGGSRSFATSTTAFLRGATAWIFHASAVSQAVP